MRRIAPGGIAMKKLLLLALVSLSAVETAAAQDRVKTATAPTPAPSLRRDVSPTSATVQQTPEMWFYEQERTLHQDPKVAVRRKAELRGAQRADRIASMEWFGMSNSRPSACPVPIMGTYSPTWTANGPNPSHWHVGRDTATTLIYVR
jgi:hypothetical protein